MFRFDADAGRKVDAYDSSGLVISRVAHLKDEAVVSCVYLKAGGVIGNHQATVPQLFMVIAGEGWVRSESGQRAPVSAGQAAYWEESEWHESGTDSGMTAIIIESRELDPAAMMPSL